MTTRGVGLWVWLACLGASQLALAQDNEPAPPAGGEEPAAPPAANPTPPAGEEPAAPPPSGGEEPAAPGSTPPPAAQPAPSAAPAVNPYANIYAVPHRFVLKRRRLELLPTYNVSFNNPLIRHHGFGGQLDFYLSEAFFIGVEGTYYVPETTSRYFLLGVDQRVLPSANQYVWSALLDVGYIPIYGKFTLFNLAVFHWEVWVAAGVGVMQTQVLPRNPALQDLAFTNYVVDVLLPGVGARIWLSRWLAVDAYYKNYIFVDKLEPLDHSTDKTAADAQNHGVDTFTLNSVFGVGLTLMVPPSFEYKTLR